QHVWFAAGDRLNAFDPASGETVRSIEVAAHAGTAFDGRHLFQIAEDRIQKIDPVTGEVLSSIPAPGGGRDSGLAWAEGTLWVGQYRESEIRQIDPETGKVLTRLTMPERTEVRGWNRTEAISSTPAAAGAGGSERCASRGGGPRR